MTQYLHLTFWLEPSKTFNCTNNDSLFLQVLKFSQADVNRMRREWELDYQARFLSKERDWVKKYEDQEREVDKLTKQVDSLTLSINEHE